ncbi:glycosyltransferase [Flavicella sp.]|uniref:glycosyltransferase family 2 protein n=1 Tax=Flavicella sp. TaxID=2957742 RepID=UPI0030158E4A
MPFKPSIELSVVIVNYNVYNFLELCLKSVEKACSSLTSEIIVVDNASSDNSCELVSKNFPNVQLICNKENVGFSKANNQGVEIAKGEFLLILNPDTVVGENTFKELFCFSKGISNLGAVGVQLIDGTGTYLPESKRGVPTLKTSFNRFLGKDKNKGVYYANDVPQEGVGAVDVLVGAFMFLKTKIYREVGGFDEDYYMYGEDIDLSYKLLKKGCQNYYLGTSKTIHFKGESTKKDVKYLKYFHGAMKIFYKKHFTSNFFKDTGVKSCIRLWYLFKYLRLVAPVIIISERENVLYVGDKKVSIDKDIHRDLNFGQFNSIKQLERYIKKNTIEEVWFDESTLSYEIIIDIISQLDSEKLNYKIHSEYTHYVIGSNSSDGRGEIINLL